MHRVKVRGVPGVGWEQLEGKCLSISGRFEQFQCCLQRSESVDDGEVVWCQKKNHLRVFFIFNFAQCQGAI